jgi:predicted membrane protein
MDNERGYRALNPTVLLGIFLALIGVLLTLDRLELIEANHILRFWPVAPILLGALVLFQATDTGGRLNGMIIMGIGAWLLLNTQGLIRVRFWELFWPVILIIIGVNLATQTLRRRSPGSAADSDSRISIFAVWSGVRRATSASPFRGAEITALMGGGQLDLRTATIPPGEEAVIHVTAVMGGFEIIVPSTWDVSMPLVAFMGGIEDGRLPPLGGQDRGVGADRTPRLVIRGFAMMGGVQVKS